MHQRWRTRAWRLVRASQREPRKPSRRRSARGRRLELRSAKKCALLIQYNDLRTRRCAGVRAAPLVLCSSWRRPDSAARSTCSIVGSSDDSPLVRSPILSFLNSRSRLATTTTFSAHWTTSDSAAHSPTHAFAMPCISSRADGSQTADGSSITPMTKLSPYLSGNQLASRVGGTRSARCGCSVGTTAKGHNRRTLPRACSYYLRGQRCTPAQRACAVDPGARCSMRPTFALRHICNRRSGFSTGLRGVSIAIHPAALQFKRLSAEEGDALCLRVLVCLLLFYWSS